MPIWEWNSTRKYTAASTYAMLCEGGIRFQLAAPIWKCGAPLSCKIFMWLATQYRLWTSDRRTRHGLQDSTSPCYLCEQEEDTVDHILVQCAFAKQVWFQCFVRVGLPLELMPTGQDTMEDWWTTSRKLVPKTHRKDYDPLVVLICWCLWKQHNGRVFGRNDNCNEIGTV